MNTDHLITDIHHFSTPSFLETLMFEFKNTAVFPASKRIRFLIGSRFKWQPCVAIKEGCGRSSLVMKSKCFGFSIQ